MTTTATKRTRRTRPNALHLAPYTVGERIGIRSLKEGDIVAVWDTERDTLRLCEYFGHVHDDFLESWRGHCFTFVDPWTLEGTRERFAEPGRFILKPEHVVFSVARDAETPSPEEYKEARKAVYSDTSRTLYTIATGGTVERWEALEGVAEAGRYARTVADMENDNAIGILAELLDEMNLSEVSGAYRPALDAARELLNRKGVCV